MHIAEAKERLRIPEIWARLNLPGQPKASCKSPFRKDRRASFSVSGDGRLWNDFAEGNGGDAIDFLRRATGLSRLDACRRFIDFAGDDVRAPRLALRSPGNFRRRGRPQLPEFEKGSVAELKDLARLRNLSIEGLQLASERGLLRFAKLRGVDSWIVRDNARVNAQARRMDGRAWEHLEGVKSWTLPASWAGWPIGAKKSQSFSVIALCEGGPDLLAAFHFGWCEDRECDVAPVAILGASQRIHQGALPLFAGKRIRIFPHLDSMGRQAAERWARQLIGVGAEVDCFDFSGLQKTSGESAKDLNDCSSICPDDFETNRDLWRLMP